MLAALGAERSPRLWLVGRTLELRERAELPGGRRVVREELNQRVPYYGGYVRDYPARHPAESPLIQLLPDDPTASG